MCFCKRFKPTGEVDISTLSPDEKEQLNIPLNATTMCDWCRNKLFRAGIITREGFYTMLNDDSPHWAAVDQIVIYPESSPANEAVKAKDVE